MEAHDSWNWERPYTLRPRLLYSLPPCDFLLYVCDMTHKIGKDRIFYALEDRIVYAQGNVYFTSGPYTFRARPYTFSRDRILYLDRILSRTVCFTYQDRILYYLLLKLTKSEAHKSSVFVVKILNFFLYFLYFSIFFVLSILLLMIVFITIKSWSS